ncbi:MAG TPA: hypothetical protein VK659_08870, partial [Asanoa sp.]|nr:hypothetical protein [Asanoa sp.]
PAAAPAKATRAPRRKTIAATEEPAPSAGEPATRVEVADKPVETGTPFGGLTGSAAPAKPRRRKTAGGLPAPEATDAGPAHTAVAALVAKRPTTRRPATKASTKRPAADNRATPTDQAS